MFRPREKYNFAVLSIASAIFLGGMAGTRPLVPLLANELGASHAEIGAIVSLNSILPLIFIVKIGRFIDQIGTKIPLIASACMGCVALAIPAFYMNLPGIYVSQLFAGFSSTIFIVSAQSFIGNNSLASERESNITIFSIGAAIGGFLGPLLGGLLSDYGSYPIAFGILGALGLFSSVFTSFLIERKRADKSNQTLEQGRKTYQLLKSSNIRRAFLISVLVLLAKDIYTAYFPLLGEEFGLSTTMIGVIISINALAGIFIRWMMPKLIEWFGRNSVIVSSLLVSGFFYFLMPFAHDFYILAVFSFFIGLGLGIGQPLSVSTTILALPKDRVAEGLGLRISFNRLTQVLAPVIFGGLSELIGLASIFWSVGLIVMLGSVKTRIQTQVQVEVDQ